MAPPPELGPLPDPLVCPPCLMWPSSLAPPPWCPRKRVFSLSRGCSTHEHPHPAPPPKLRASTCNPQMPSASLSLPVISPGHSVSGKGGPRSERAGFGRASRGLWPSTARGPVTDAESQGPADRLGQQLRFSKSSNVQALRNASPLAADGVSSTRGRAPAVLCSCRAVLDVLGRVGPPAPPGPGTSAWP